jgi:putative proteasome-type protease
MTYCCGILVADGLVMVADTRTNAGLDDISTFRKLHLFRAEGRYAIAIATAGNLSATQTVINLLEEGVEGPDCRNEAPTVRKIEDAPSLYAVAQLVGRAARQARRLDSDAYQQASLAFHVSFLVGGQIGEERPRLFLVYAAGNFIECTPDSPFLQIGEYKFGKPVLDRALTYRSSLDEALKLALISMDSTVKSNLGVGLPIDVATIRRDAHTFETDARIEASDPYFRDLGEHWSAALRAAAGAMASPPYGAPRDHSSAAPASNRLCLVG